MSIRPIDMVTIAPKSQEVSQVHFNEMRGRDNAAATVNQSFQRTEEHDSKRTVQMTKGDTQSYEFDAKDSSGNAYHGGNKKKKNGENDQKPQKKQTRDPYASGFDIKI